MEIVKDEFARSKEIETFENNLRSSLPKEIQDEVIFELSVKKVDIGVEGFDEASTIVFMTWSLPNANISGILDFHFSMMNGEHNIQEVVRKIERRVYFNKLKSSISDRLSGWFEGLSRLVSKY